MDDNKQFEMAAAALLARCAYRFERISEILEATNARMSNNVQRLNDLKTGHEALRDRIDKISR